MGCFWCVVCVAWSVHNVISLVCSWFVLIWFSASNFYFFKKNYSFFFLQI